MPVSGWVRIQDPRSSTGEPVSIAYVNLRQASGLGVHQMGDTRVIKARFADGSERTLVGEYADDAQARAELETLLATVAG